jgi:hypothetical protein
MRANLQQSSPPLPRTPIVNCHFLIDNCFLPPDDSQLATYSFPHATGTGYTVYFPSRTLREAGNSVYFLSRTLREPITLCISLPTRCGKPATLLINK